MIRQLRIQRSLLGHAMSKDDLHAIEFTRVHRESLQRVLQPSTLEIDRRQTASECSRALDRVIDQTRDAVDFRRQRRIFRRESPCKSAQHQRDSSEFLAQTIVQIVADPVLLAIHRLQYASLQLLAFADVLQNEQAVIAPRDVESGEHTGSREAFSPTALSLELNGHRFTNGLGVPG